MTTDLAIHRAKLPTANYTDYGWFVVLKLTVPSEDGHLTQVIMYLPEGTTLGNVSDALSNITVDEVVKTASFDEWQAAEQASQV